MASRTELRDRYRRVMDRVAQAAERSGRRADDVLVVAVTKTASPDQIRQIIEMGHQDLGENRVQQLIQRVATIDEFVNRHHKLTAPRRGEMPERIRWHMVGHLQRNKVKTVLPLVKLIHGVDSLRLVEELQVQAAKLDRDVDVLMEVNIAGESSKDGVAPAAALHLAEQIDTMLHVRLRGLMVMAPMTDDPEAVRPIFKRASELLDDIRKEGLSGGQFNILSMGMSDDFEVAIECGANIVRIGRAIFGEGDEAPAEET